MYKRFNILIFLIAMAVSVFAKDTVVLKNGDTMTGIILEQNDRHIYFKSPAFGTVALKTADIKEIRTAPVEAQKKNTPAEAATPAPKKTTAPAAKEQKVSQEKKSQTPAPKKKAKTKKRWSGQTGLAIAMREKTTSNQNGVYKEEKYETYRFYGNLKWKGDRNDLSWAWNYRYGRDTGETKKIRDDYLNITQQYKHTFRNNNLFAAAKTVYQQDYNRRIEHEYLQTAELGIKWFDKSSKIQLSTSAGGGYHKYDRIDSSRTEVTSYGKPKFIFEENFSWKLINSLTLRQKYTHLGDLTDYHFVFSAGLENKLINELFLRIEYKLDRDTEVFYDDKGYYDKALLTSILYKF